MRLIRFGIDAIPNDGQIVPLGKQFHQSYVSISKPVRNSMKISRLFNEILTLYKKKTKQSADICVYTLQINLSPDMLGIHDSDLSKSPTARDPNISRLGARRRGIQKMGSLFSCHIFHYLKSIDTLRDLCFDGWTFPELTLFSCRIRILDRQQEK